MLLIISIILLLNISQIIGQKGETITIDTQLGKITGTVHKGLGGKQTVYSFTGIKFGVPPIGNLRFRQAQLNDGDWKGTYDGTQFGAECMQPYSTGAMDEDCLYLHIWTPKPNKTAPLLPVMVWIYGGGFTTGSGEYYPGINIIGEGKDFVYVSINYRLGNFGFLQNAELYTEDPNWKSYGGMNGIYDQIQGLNYVKKFISDYGGDPNQITIFGESAGGLSVCYLCISPLAKGLFQRAIVESGACNGPWGARNATYGLQMYNELLEKAGYPTNNLTYLRSIPAKQFLDRMGYPPLTWEAVVDDLVITDTAPNIFANLKNNGLLNVNKFIIGFNTLDAINMKSNQPTTSSEYKDYIDYYIKNTTEANLVYTHYYPSSDFPSWSMDGAPAYNSYQLAWFTINTDVCLSCPSIKIGEQVDEQINNNIMYIYQFGGATLTKNVYYAPHSSEIPFVFDNGNVKSGLIPWNQQLSNEMVSAWTNFGKYGIPNITDSIDNINVNWNLFGGLTESNVMLYEGTTAVKVKQSFKQNYRNNVCDFWYNEIGIDTMTDICVDAAKVKV